MSDAIVVPQENRADMAVAEGGAYEVLQKRLQEQGQRLQQLSDTLNQQRLNTFGSSQMETIGRVRVRTANNCIARDIVQVGDYLLFGYNVFIGLKRETTVEDVFSLHRLVELEESYEAESVPLIGSFLTQPGFVNDFNELYTYYKSTRLLQLAIQDGKLLASFQIGERITDIRVFRWSISVDGQNVRYIDNRGERDIALPATFDFEWKKTSREMIEQGRHPHINILDTVFVETIGGHLTLKVENNTREGNGIYSEPVQDLTQSLDDAQIEFARLGSLILLKILPYQEEQWRYLVFNSLIQQVIRIDAIGLACMQLPEDHGIIFPGGCYLQSGECKTFEQSMTGMRFKRIARSPNGEDVQFIFYNPEQGRSALFTYNLINRQLQSPIFGHGYARLEDGRMVIFSSEGDEPTRIHPMQIWQTPFCSEEFAARQPARNDFFGRIGNSDLVRGISDLIKLCREIESREISVARYVQLCQTTRRLFDAYHWLEDAQCDGLAPLLRDIAATGERVLDEFEKVHDIQQQSIKVMAEAETQITSLFETVATSSRSSAQDFVDALNALNAQQGRLLTIRSYRYIDMARIDAMQAELLEIRDSVAAETSVFLTTKAALQPFYKQLDELNALAQKAETASQLSAPFTAMQTMAGDLDMLSELMTSLDITDVTRRTMIAESISEIYARLNQAKAQAEQLRKKLGTTEKQAQFGAQLKLFGQSITSAIAQALDPERCDEQLSRLLLQLENLESQFGEHEQFLNDILIKREELLETFETRKLTLQDERQRRVQVLYDAALRTLTNLTRRASRIAHIDEINAFFAADPMILKLHEMIERFRKLKDSVKAEDIETRLKNARDQAVRSLRDKHELFEEGGNVIRLGPRHRFSVNIQDLDLTLMPRGDQLYLHLTGTDFLEPLEHPELQALRPYWQISLESESPQLYRAEYLAGEVLAAADSGKEEVDLDQLKQLVADPNRLARHIRDFAASRYREGYEKGIHDHDATLILSKLLPLRERAGLLQFSPEARGLASFFLAQQLNAEKDIPLARRTTNLWGARARNSRHIEQLFGLQDGLRQLEQDATLHIHDFVEREGLKQSQAIRIEAAEYLVRELAADRLELSFSKYARDLLSALQAQLISANALDEYLQTLTDLEGNPAQQWFQVENWLLGLCSKGEMAEFSAYVPEAVSLTLSPDALSKHITEVDLSVTLDNMMGEHPRVNKQHLVLTLDDFFSRLRLHRQQFLPALHHYQTLRQSVIHQQREALRLDEFKPRPLSSFVRNKLINDIYLGFIGDNLAKQIGALGVNKRTDLMGLLMLISPPGYGKTTLMEYIAHRLGLVFMKINGPALGHQVRSIDPGQAPDATSRQELEKLNLALEMGNNVMLYVDDIQHTHPEFLQKFISLCDGTRRMEGVWRGKTKTYDLRGKKFCVVMAGNPYTESGEVFAIPDMLANRADIYNLGDTLSGMQETFDLSYLENTLTSNPILAPLATRDMSDVYRFIARAEGKPFSSNELMHSYSTAEINEIVATFERLMQVRDVVSEVNRHYIISAAQADAYRTEPPFKLQGSYRNMNKMAEKVSAAMNDSELVQLIDDHYQGESQLLTTSAEENLLKLAELRGNMSSEQRERWEQIKHDFMRNRSIGNSDVDTGSQVVAQLGDLVEGLRVVGNNLQRQS